LNLTASKILTGTFLTKEMFEQGKPARDTEIWNGIVRKDVDGLQRKASIPKASPNSLNPGLGKEPFKRKDREEKKGRNFTRTLRELKEARGDPRILINGSRMRGGYHRDSS